MAILAHEGKECRILFWYSDTTDTGDDWHATELVYGQTYGYLPVNTALTTNIIPRPAEGKKDIFVYNESRFYYNLHAIDFRRCSIIFIIIIL